MAFGALFKSVVVQAQDTEEEGGVPQQSLFFAPASCRYQQTEWVPSFFCDSWIWALPTESPTLWM
jgi:hypothetical protein